MLFKISFKNIRKSIRDYTVYFFTLAVGVSIFYVFNAIESQTVMMEVSSSTREIIKIMTEMLSGVSVFVSFVLGFLVIYASRFLMKRRNKEFAIYLLLGMKKRKISKILLLETLMVGVISLIAGLGIGIILSQFMSAFIANMFEADMTEFTFVFSKAACMKTVTYFGIMYIVVMLFNTISITKCKLIDLLYAGKKSERIRMKNPWICTLVFLVSAAGLGYAYYQVSLGAENFQKAGELFVPVVIGAVTTFFIFWSAAGLLLRAVSSIKGLYYRGLNSFTLRQLSSKMNTTVWSMTVICLMLFVTICVLINAFSIKNSMDANLDETAPADIEIVVPWAAEQQSVLECYQSEGIDAAAYLREYTAFSVYETPELTFGDTFGTGLEKVQQSFPFLNYDTPEMILKISDYNKAAELYGNETFTLAEDEYIIVADFGSMVEIRNDALKAGEHIQVFGRDLKPKFTSCQDGFVEMSSQHINVGIILVPDEAADGDFIVSEHLIGNYRANSKEERLKIEEIFFSHPKASDYISNTRILIAEASIGLGALVTFIGLYLGLVFLISGAVILALKELAESADNVERFRMLRRLGAEEKMIHRALFAQIGLFFLFPLLLAGIHSVFGMIFSRSLLEIFSGVGLLPAVFLTVDIVGIIYGGYLLITYFCSKSMIREAL